MENYNGKLGEVFLLSEKPVILFDVSKGSYRQFDTIEEASSTRKRESRSDSYAAVNPIYKLKPEQPDWELVSEP
jgi:hypothetical protein